MALHTCTQCGKTEAWGPTWRWYSDGYPKGGPQPWWAGDPVVRWEACCYECARAIDPASPTDEAMAAAERRAEAKEARAVERERTPRPKRPREPYKTKTELKRELAEAQRRIAELEATK